MDELYSTPGESNLRRILLIIAMLCFAAICSNSMAANQPTKAIGLNQLKSSNSSLNVPAANPQVKVASSQQAPQGNIVGLKQDSWSSGMSLNLAISPTYGSAQVVKFSPPNPGWKLEDVLVMATDGWNSTSNQLPKLLPFVIEIRDANLKLLYHFSDTQLPYFTNATSIRMAVIEMPELTINGDFFVCFYGYRSLAIAAQPSNATGNSYYFDKLTGQIFPGNLPTRNNQSIPVNWLIRVVGR